MKGQALDTRQAKARTALKELSRLLREHGEDAAERKLASLEALASGVLPTAEDVLQLHELLCFLTAYPDSPAVLDAARDILATFGARSDLRANREDLADTGIAGTAIHCDFYWFTAEWLSRRWPEQLTVDWDHFETQSHLDELMYSILQEHERLAYEGTTSSLREIIDVLKAPGETDAVYLTESFRRLHVDPMVLEQLYDSIGLAMRLSPGPSTPSRTRAFFPVPELEYQTQAIPKPTGTVLERVEQDPDLVRHLSLREGMRIVQLGREAMITRGRDLFAFIHADARDAHLIDFGEGLQFSCVGLTPERRHLLYGQYILMALKNGIPVGYIQSCVLFDSAEVNFNVFDTFRGAEASRIFVSSLALIRHLFGVDTFTINSQQLGQGNREALETGAWWFYHKHGFRPRHPDALGIMRRELAAKQRDPEHRSSISTLEELSAWELYFHLDEPRQDVIGQVDVSRIGARLTTFVGERLGVSGKKAAQVASREAARLLEVEKEKSWSRGETLAWNRWAPLVIALPSIADWSRTERQELVHVIRHKGGVSEGDYIEAFRRHPKLADAVLELAL